MKTCCFMTNMIQSFCDTDLTFCFTISKEQGFFLRAKKSQTLMCPYGQLCQLIFVPRRKSKGSIVLGSSVRPSVRRHTLVSATPPTVFKGFWWNFPDIVAMSWRWSYFIEIVLDWFYQSYSPLAIFVPRHKSKGTVVLGLSVSPSQSCLRNSAYSF